MNLTDISNAQATGLLVDATRAQESGDLAAARALCLQILETSPDEADALNLLGVLECQLGNPEAGIVSIAKASAVNPDHAGFLNNLGTGLSALGREQDAVLVYRRALELEPAHATAHNNIATLYRNSGQLEKAAEHFEKALETRPDYAEAMSNYGNVLLDLGQVDRASEVLEQAIAINPDYVFSYNNLGIVRQRQGRFAEAEQVLRKAIERAPGFADPYTNLAEILKETGRVEEALDPYRKSMALAPDQASLHSNYIYALHNLETATPAQITEAHRDWSRQHAHSSGGALGLVPPENRRLRIGYVSSDFRQHSVSYFFEPIIRYHDARKFEVFLYSNGHLEDAVTARLRAGCQHWRSIYGLSDDVAFDLIQADHIDILVDLSGHTMGNRLTLFARRPALRQVSYLGYPATTGLPQMDYRLTDTFADPEGQTETYHSEKLMRLEGGFLCYQPPSDAPDIAPRPRLKNGYVTFGSCNNLAKITPTVIATWAAILHAVPGSKLLLKAKPLGDASVRDRIQKAFQAEGIAAERLDLRAWIAGSSHLDIYNCMDIALDPFPYNGTTTICETMWMGVPTIALAGQWHSARVALSLAAMAGCPELVANDLAAYRACAIDLANSPQRLDTYGPHLRSTMAASRLCNGADFTRALEQAYEDIARG